MVEAPKYLPLHAYLPLLEILLSAFNAILFGLLSFLCWSDFRKGRPPLGGPIYFGIVVAGWLLFTAHMGNLFATGLGVSYVIPLGIVETLAKFMVAPMVFHLFSRIEQGHLPGLRMWRFGIGLVYAAAVACAAAEVNAATLVFANGWPGWARTTEIFQLLLAVAIATSGLVICASRRPRVTRLQRNERTMLLWLCGASVFAFLWGSVSPNLVNDLLGKLIPLLFVYVFTYYVERFAFFDVLVKQGAFVFSALLLLTLYFLVVPPLLWRLHFVNWSGTLVWAISVWPIVLLAPWGHRKLSAWLDRLWLGRPYPPAAATKYFLSGLQGAINEDELARAAEHHLSRIFRSHAEVVLGPSAPPSANAADLMTAPIRMESACAGEIRIEPRARRLRFQSEDLALLASLAEAFAFLLENLRLRETRLQQERREQELLLDVNRSELKALRAQINPHFLFNALNTIAAMISRHPDRAEETIEELAEVFRYTLRGSTHEWATLSDELEAVRSYLHIEQARFGESLQFRILCDPAAHGLRIPAMVVQTLVENAVKHGVASITRPRRVEVRVEVAGPRLRIEVRDNGPGFTAAVIDSQRSGENAYGLRNIRERLQRYFGTGAQLDIGRDEHDQMTVVSIDMPRAARAAGALS